MLAILLALIFTIKLIIFALLLNALFLAQICIRLLKIAFIYELRCPDSDNIFLFVKKALFLILTSIVNSEIQ